MARSETRPDRVQQPQAAPPAAAGRGKVLLSFAQTKAERRALEDWLLRDRDEGERAPEMLEASDPDLGARLRERTDDPEVVPVRVAWLPIDYSGPAVHLKDILTLTNPRHPRQRQQQRILRTHPDRVRVLQGAAASVSDLGRRFRDFSGGGSETEFAAFVRRQGVLALDRAERTIVGQRYKAARMVPEEVLASAHLRDRLGELATSLGRPAADVAREAKKYLEEMAAEHSELAIDSWEQFIRFVVRQYSIDIETQQLERLRRIGARHSLAYLPSHRSYMDPFILRTVLHRHGLPPNHVLGGINVAFWPMGTIARRSGIVFIRRSYKDKPVYSVVLREYISYLIHKRFNLEWYIEGGRTRTGKLRPPRYGILAYVIDALRHGAEDDVYVVPTAIVYDQLPEVGDIAFEDQGGEKERESFKWMIGYLRRQAEVQGTAYVRFGEPLSLREAILTAGSATSENGHHPPAQERDLTIEKVAFEIMHRINRATPITPPALLTTALLGIADRALTLGELRHVLEPLLDYVTRRNVPITEDILQREGGLRGLLDALTRTGLVTLHTGGPEDAWSVTPARHLEAAFYRNSIVHYLLNRAIVELIAMRAAEEPFDDALREAWHASLELRDLLKFEFFFAPREEFGQELRAELAAFDPDWETRGAEQEQVWDHLTSTRLFVAHRVLGPYIQAYYVVADRLAALDPSEKIDEKEFVKLCIGTARQYRAQQRIWSSEAISKELFTNALRLADNRGLLTPGDDELQARRKALATELRILLFRVRRIRDLAVRDLDTVIEGWPAR
ncbi:MAG TPA: glycerol-3-phosphate 1-O-acyltransferase [Candidatus Dormibacteraeota bacterium]